MKLNAPCKPRPKPSLSVSLAFAALTLPSRAVVFQLGEVKGSLDTTLSIGVLDRLNNPDPARYGITNSFNGVLGQPRSVNNDDGDLNYKRGVASSLIKASEDLQLN